MSFLTNQFLDAAKRSDVPKITGTPRLTLDGQTTFVKQCGFCGQHMPHIRAEDYTECVLCGTKTYAFVKPESG